MAANQTTKRDLYRSNGSAAYDVRTNYGNTAPQRQPAPSRLPEERRRPARHVRVKAKTAVSPFAIFGMAAAVCMLVLVVFGYVQLYEATAETGALQQELSSLTYDSQMLKSEYEGKIDLAAVETRATRELGMMQPNAGQTVYLNLSGSDRAVITQEVKQGPIASIVESIQTSISGLLSYLS